MAVYRKHISGDTLIILDKRIPAELKQAEHLLNAEPIPSWMPLISDFLNLQQKEVIAVGYGGGTHREGSKAQIIDSALGSQSFFPLIAIVVDTKRILKDLIHGS